MHIKKENIQFFLLQGLYWASYCALFGYTVIIFGSYGYGAQVCGIVATLQYVVLLAIQPLYGFLMDNVISPKWLFVILMSLGGVAALGLPWAFSSELPVVVGYFLLLSFFNFCSHGVVDTWCIQMVNRTSGMDYGMVRGGGSIFYASTGLVLGNVVSSLGVPTLFAIHVALSAAAVALALALPNPMTRELRAHVAQSGDVQKPSLGKALALLIKNKPFIIYTLCMTLYIFSSRAPQVYMPNILAEAGGNSSHYGLSMFIASGGEMFVMLYASRLLIRGMPMERMFGIALGFFSLRLLLLLATANLTVILLGQALMAVGFGLQVRVHIQYLSQITPKGYHATAILLSGAVSSGVGAMTGNFFGGMVIDRFGIQPYLILATAVMLLSLALFLPTLGRLRKLEKEKERLTAMAEQALGPQ